MASASLATYEGQRWLVEERDACGVGFIASVRSHESHDLVLKALSALTCLEHRGGCNADKDSGDGAGILTALPLKLLTEWMNSQGIEPPNPEELGVGMLFLPREAAAAAKARQEVERVLAESEFTLLGWRPVPVKPNVLGVLARQNQPTIEQVLVKAPHRDGMPLVGDELERELYLTRRKISRAVEHALGTDEDMAEELEEFYVCSFSSRTIVYKGMVRSVVLGEFYTDLTNTSYESAFAFYHRRFSTNTMPRWPLAQPMRLLGHNGEINTLVGNINWMQAREADLEHPLWGDRLSLLTPTVRQENSDSANLDNVLELLVRSGRTPLESIMLMVPEAYRNQPELDDYPEIVDFYDYYSGLQEPWDGPALLVFSDGKMVGAALDRNGLRPARYVITRDDYVVVASEAGVVPMAEEDIVEKGRLGPGQTIAVDLENHEILRNWDIKQRIAHAQPYGQWLKDHRHELETQGFGEDTYLDGSELLKQQSAFGYTSEDVEMIIEAMAAQGKEPTFCMGDDIPLAILSSKPRLLYDYFKQRFAQVTNPAIDPLRESLVMSLSMTRGARGNVLEAKPDYARQIKLDSPVLNDAELACIHQTGFKTATLSTLYSVSDGPQGLKQAIATLCQQADDAVQQGTEILVLSDRLRPDGTEGGASDAFTYLPPLAVVGAVHHHLIRQGLRMKVSLVVDTAQCWSTHHFACLIGYGASAVCPYLALESVRHWWRSPKTQSLMEKGRLETMDIETAQQNYRKAVEAGLLKILSKMGISLLSSYHGAQIFEAIGIGGDLLETAFRGTASRVGGLTFEDLAQETSAIHQRAFPELTAKKLQNLGFVQYRPGGEYHMNSPEMSKALHKAVADKAYDHYEVYKTHLA
ncbi:MAG: glutamate synthase central domain-containing protein, partial [Leptolyngbyaceae bacterium]|nr:glutamate synthase central domain-containing protein [Leptolyngbyaceae bacterium]